MSTGPKAHVLVVEDDAPSRAILAYLAEDQGRARVSQAASAREMHAILARDAANLIILDLNLPDESGLSLARQLRTRSEVPIIVVTGDDSRDTRLAALEIGVDDFQTKPYDLKELGLRIRNQLRRSMAIRRPGQLESSARVAFAGFVLDHSERILERAEGPAVHLTPNEFMILAALLRRRNSSVSRASLLDAIGDSGDGPSDRAVDIYIKNLRAKIESDPRTPVIIATVRGFGYRLVG
ncbi:MAG: response regulator transcription factor [Thalassobaculum sp.]|uniref:response regulator transcription factor n=1 Tax=Thalassobaculum sp. TaxID=2022740 RepID=UPI0032EE0DBC